MEDRDASAGADEVWFNGRIYTTDPSFSRVPALAWKNGYICYAGDDEGARKLAGRNTAVENLAGKAVFPGFIDTHLHLEMYGDSLFKLCLRGCSKDQIIRLVQNAAERTPAGEWIVGGLGWDNGGWEDTSFPSLRDLDHAAPHNPVLLPRIDGHMVWLNSRALAAAGITEETPNPPGGEFLRGPDGRLAGCASDAAADLVRKKIPPCDKKYRQKILLAAQDKLLGFGVTGVQDASSTEDLVESLKELYRSGLFKLRVSGALINALGDHADPGMAKCLARGPEIGLFDGSFTIRAVKLFADGSLGSGTAALMEDYSDRPGYRGKLMYDEAELYRLVFEAAKRGMQLMVHAIGDAAIDETLSVFERVITGLSLKDHRFRIEHFQLIQGDFCHRAKRLGVLAAMQGAHGPNNASMAEQRLGSGRAENSYALGKVQRILGRIAGGSDAPVANPNPLDGIHAALTRTNDKLRPPGGFYPENALSRDAAVRSYTSWAAYALFADRERGSLEAGKRADLVLLDRDLMEVPPDDIPGIQVLRTVIGGETVYRRGSVSIPL
ncbi:MAG: amidohydrolase [Spirochaetaceae bacterium]|nr:amidohydrolase [Spirochaetaceae bacterium]